MLWVLVPFPLVRWGLCLPPASLSPMVCLASCSVNRGHSRRPEGSPKRTSYLPAKEKLRLTVLNYSSLSLLESVSGNGCLCVEACDGVVHLYKGVPNTARCFNTLVNGNGPFQRLSCGFAAVREWLSFASHWKRAADAERACINTRCELTMIKSYPARTVDSFRGERSRLLSC